MATSNSEQAERATVIRAGESVASFTRGPWRVVEGDRYRHIARDDDWVAVVSVETGPGGTAWPVISEADAALIAAAPDMYAALEEARRVVSGYWPLVGPESEPEKSTVALLNQNDAALTKARGT